MKTNIAYSKHDTWTLICKVHFQNKITLRLVNKDEKTDPTSEQVPNFWFGVSIKLVVMKRTCSPWKQNKTKANEYTLYLLETPTFRAKEQLTCCGMT